MEKNFGDKIRLSRIEKHLTQTELAKLIGVSRTVVSQWENDLLRPTFEHLVKLVHELEIKEL